VPHGGDRARHNPAAGSYPQIAAGALPWRITKKNGPPAVKAKRLTLSAKALHVSKVVTFAAAKLPH
jgi:hypothetical protein